MSLLDKAKKAAEQAATMAKEGVEDVQQKRELSQAYNSLGEKAFELLDAGEISHPKLEESAGKIREVKAKIAASPGGSEASGETAHDPEQPPATPN